MIRIWRHPTEGDEVTMVFIGPSWQVRCPALGLDTQVENQPPEDLDLTLIDLVDECRNRAKVKPQKTIWDIITSMIEEGLSIAPPNQKVIFESKTQTVSAFHDRDGRLRLITLTRARRPVVSEVLAYNPPTAAADDWRLVARAKEVYEAWVKDVKRGCRPLWHFRPEVDAIILERSVGRDAAIKIFQEKGGINV